MSNMVRCLNCQKDFAENELLKEKMQSINVDKEICPNCGKDVFYDLKEVNGKVLTFATRV